MINTALRICRYKLWPTNSNEFHAASTFFSHDDSNYNWNYLDHYVTGEGEDCNLLLEVCIAAVLPLSIACAEIFSYRFSTVFLILPFSI